MNARAALALLLAGCAQLDVVADPALFVEDFETCDYSRWSGTDPGSMRIDATVTHGGACSSEYGFAPDVVSTRFASFDPAPDVWLTLWVRFQPGFVAPQPTRGLFLATLEDDLGEMNASLYLPVGGAVLGARTEARLAGSSAVEARSRTAIDGSSGAWHCAELHARANTLGSADGALELFVDGAMLVGQSVSLRGSTERLFSRVVVQPRVSGSGAWPAGNLVHVDDLVVAGARIGCPGPL